MLQDGYLAITPLGRVRPAGYILQAHHVHVRTTHAHVCVRMHMLTCTCYGTGHMLRADYGTPSDWLLATCCCTLQDAPHMATVT